MGAIEKELIEMGASVIPTPTDDTSKCSEMKRIEAGDEGPGLRTLDCLRGRLLAERQASRVAKDEAELMANKLMELEKKLKEETKLRRRAEKKLKLLMRKLESLKNSQGLELSSSSGNISSSGASSCTSSLTSVSCPKDHEECDSKSQIAISLEDKSSSTTQDSCGSSSSLRTPKDDPCSFGESSYGSSGFEHEPSFYNSKVTESKANQKGDEINGSDGEDCMDNSMALVPIASAPSTTTKASDESLIPIDNRVGEVLYTLKLVREKLQSAIGRRNHIIRLGPV